MNQTGNNSYAENYVIESLLIFFLFICFVKSERLSEKALKVVILDRIPGQEKKLLP